VRSPLPHLLRSCQAAHSAATFPIPGRCSACGARNLPAPANLDPETSTVLSAEVLAERWAAAGVPRDKRVITYCGGGVFAAFSLFALHLLGHERAALYDASWSEWGADEDLPVETGPARDRS
jgi:thiosulfate/3-mercaptopyruvate sulfurtransferase